MKKSKAIFVTVIVIFLSSCQWTKEKGKSVIYFRNKSYSRSTVLDPSKLKFVSEYYYLDNLSINLTEVNAEEAYVNQLAEEIILSKDEKTLSIKIKEAYFSNGDMITAKDVVNSLKRGILYGTPHFDARNLYLGAEKLKQFDDDIEGLQVSGERSLEIKLKNPTKEIFYYLNLTDTAIMHSSLVKKESILASDWTQVSSGPYILTYDDSERAVLKKNDKSFLGSDKSPSEIVIAHKDLPSLIKEMEDNDSLFGSLSFREFLSVQDQLNKLKSYIFSGSKIDGILTLSLNINSNKFKSQEVRQWVLKRIIENLHIQNHESTILQKAYQYFVPGAKGYIADARVLDYLDSDITSKVPDALKEGIQINTIPGMKNYIPDHFDERLSKILGIPITISFDVGSKVPFKQSSPDKVEAYLMATSMSYKVIGETLNFSFNSENAIANDPTGNIKNWLNEYQSTDNQKEEERLLQNILKQITIDSEVIPLFYFGQPYFYNKNKVDISNMYLDESVEFWKMNVK